jgi:polyhydroxyalkanoate synthesis regulator phasin
MSDPIREAFLLGKACAEVLTEKIEDSLTNLLSEVGKFDAETRESLQELMQEIKARAEASKNEVGSTSRTITVEVDDSVDLQELLDELRAEIAHLKAELNNYRQKST